MDGSRVGMGRVDDRPYSMTDDKLLQAPLVERAATDFDVAVQARFQRNVGRLGNQDAIAGLGQRMAIGGASLVPPRSRIIGKSPS